MQNHSIDTRRASIIAVPVAALSAAGCGKENSSSSTTTSPSTTTAPVTSTTTSLSATTPTPTSTPSDRTSVTVYLISGEALGAAGRSGVAATPARSAMEELVKGPSESDISAGLSTAIPTGTRLLGIDIASGIATVDLSNEFGSGGGSLSMQERVAQVVFTLTQFPTVQKVPFRIDGSPATALGGEGVMVDTPQARADWESMTPAILLESPLPGAQLTSPFQITGTFKQTITFTGAARGTATLRVFERSAEDGSKINVVSIPVTI